jgi:hypothetical protein
MNALRMVLSDIGELDYMLAPDMNIGVKSPVAVNGYTEFNINTLALGKDGDIVQVQHCGASLDVFVRVFNARTYTFTSWSRPNALSEYVGKCIFDTVTGKPVWLKTVNDYVKGVYTLTLSDINVKHRFSVAVTQVATTSGTIALRVDTDSDIEFEILDTDLAADIITKMKAAVDATGEWNTEILQEGALICEKTLPGSVSVTSFIDTDTTGVEATVTILNEGVGTASGNVTLTIDGDDIVLPVVANDYAETIAAALESETIDGWSLAVGTGVDANNIVILTCLFAGDHVITFEDTDTTGISGVVATVTEGSASEWVYADGSVSGYLPEEYRAS